MRQSLHYIHRPPEFCLKPPWLKIKDACPSLVERVLRCEPPVLGPQPVLHRQEGSLLRKSSQGMIPGWLHPCKTNAWNLKNATWKRKNTYEPWIFPCYSFSHNSGSVKMEECVLKNGCMYFFHWIWKNLVVIHTFFEEKKSFPFRLPGAKSSFFETILGGTLSG